jgi:hypothetical protein
MSLEKFIDALSIETKKLQFPYKYVTKSNINYIGDIPEYEYFNKFFDIIKYENYLKLASEYNENNK